jgi:hypothetical protein
LLVVISRKRRPRTRRIDARPVSLRRCAMRFVARSVAERDGAAATCFLGVRRHVERMVRRTCTKLLDIALKMNLLLDAHLVTRRQFAPRCSSVHERVERLMRSAREKALCWVVLALAAWP